MELIRFDDLKENYCEPIVATIGAFDGIHLAHQVLIEKTVVKAKELGYKSAVITFDPHPLAILKNCTDISSINTLDNKVKLISKFNVDYLIIINFTKTFSLISKEEFVNDYLVAINVKEVIVGSDFKFAVNGSGLGSEIYKLSNKKINVQIIDILKIDNEKIGSTKIKELLSIGNIEKVNNMLGYEFFFTGKVIKGKQIGRTLGFPTANIRNDYISKLLKTGVYGVRVKYLEKVYIGMMNIGHNPTCNFTDNLSIEINLFDADIDLYDKIIEIACFCFVREEFKFKNKEELIARLTLDKEIIINKNLMLAKKSEK